MKRKLTVGSLFSGIGGFELGLERTGGFETKWQVEIDPYCQRVLAKHWPNVKRYSDIRTVTDVERVDVLCGGFPCQDLSAGQTGERLGLDGARSGLWSEFARLLCLLRPCYAIIENSPVLINNGLDRILGDIAALGMDAEWSTVSACSFRAPHTRERLFLVAYAAGDGRIRRRICQGSISKVEWDEARFGESCASQTIGLLQAPNWRAHIGGVRRVRDGVSSKVERLRGLGNAVVPQIVEWIGNRILEHEGLK